MSAFGDNPFAVLTWIAAPAILTNASSVLALGTSNRFARAIDRARALSKTLEGIDPSGNEFARLHIRQLDRVETRSLLLLHALTAFYLSLGSFAAASLISLLGASLASSTHHWGFQLAIGLALAVGVVGVGGLVFGTTLLVRETRLAVKNLSEEAAFVRNKYKDYLHNSAGTGEPG